jgi:hypothetical protein
MLFEDLQVIIAALDAGNLRAAGERIRVLPTGEFARYAMACLWFDCAGSPDRARQQIADIHIDHVERFLAEAGVLLAPWAMETLGQYVFGSAEPVPDDNGPIAMFAFPKSGSTYLECILQAYTGKPVSPMSSVNDTDGVSLDASLFHAGINARGIVRGHVSANTRCVARCVALGLRPVFIHRNLFSALQSYADHMRGIHYTYPFDVPEGVPGIEVAAYRMAFHYVEMFASWIHFAQKSGSVLVLSYEANRNDWAAAAARVLAHCGQEVDAARLGEAVSKAEVIRDNDPSRVRYKAGGRRCSGLIGDVLRERIRILYQPTSPFRCSGTRTISASIDATGLSVPGW